MFHRWSIVALSLFLHLGAAQSPASALPTEWIYNDGGTHTLSSLPDPTLPLIVQDGPGGVPTTVNLSSGFVANKADVYGNSRLNMLAGSRASSVTSNDASFVEINANVEINGFGAAEGSSRWQFNGGWANFFGVGQNATAEFFGGQVSSFWLNDAGHVITHAGTISTFNINSGGRMTLRGGTLGGAVGGTSNGTLTVDVYGNNLQVQSSGSSQATITGNLLEGGSFPPGGFKINLTPPTNVVVTLHNVPEPAAAWMAIIGCTSLRWLARRR